jgi:hypothetical protein
MSKPAFLVEGKMEQLLVQRLCPGTPVQIINCNGDNVSLHAIGKKIASLARLLDKRGHRPIVIVFDREKRSETTKTIKQQLVTLLQKDGVTAPVILGVPDRMIENWILADLDNFCRLAGVNNTSLSRDFEGTCGEAKLKKLLPKGFTYVKTIHGVEWFQTSDPDSISKNSLSFREFAEALTAVKCRWLSERRLL